MTQSIIVYRNPMEAYMWESGMMFPLIVGVIVAVMLAVGINAIIQRLIPSNVYYRSNWPSYVVIASAVIGLLGTMYLMA